MTKSGRAPLWALILSCASACTLAVDNRLEAAECSTDDECNDADACNGDEVCDVDARRCVVGTPLTCADDDDCTADACDADMGCTYTFIDVDGDGFSPATCSDAGEHAGQGGDCDDTNSARRPGAPEQCNTINDDCDANVDEEVVSIPCYRDRDGDGYPSNVPADIVMACACPAGFVPGRTDGVFDCPGRDGTDATTDFTAFALIHPDGVASPQHFCVDNATGEVRMSIPFEEGGFICPVGTFSYDYDCSGTNDKTYTNVNSTCNAACSGSGWTGGASPACGGSGQYRTCRPSFMIGGGCISLLGSRTQTCK